MTESAPFPTDQTGRLARMGERLREVRRLRRMTLAEVADRSGLAVSTISKVERGLMALTYDRFGQLADGLGVDIGALFSEEGQTFRPGEFAVARTGDFRLHRTENYVYEMLFPDLWQKAMVPMTGTLRAHETMRFDRFVSHPGEEFLMVLEGRVVIDLEDMDPVTLETGESIYFDSQRGHLYASAGKEDARILVVCTRGGRGQRPPSNAPDTD